MPGFDVGVGFVGSVSGQSWCAWISWSAAYCGTSPWKCVGGLQHCRGGCERQPEGRWRCDRFSKRDVVRGQRMAAGCNGSWQIGCDWVRAHNVGIRHCGRVHVGTWTQGKSARGDDRGRRCRQCDGDGERGHRIGELSIEDEWRVIRKCSSDGLWNRSRAGRFVTTI